MIVLARTVRICTPFDSDRVYIQVSTALMVVQLTGQANSPQNNASGLTLSS